MADKNTGKNNGKKIIANNKKAYHDYFVDETMEAGIQLFGTEVKSLRAGGVNLKDSYCYIEAGEIFATGVHISPYEKGTIFNRDPLREKKLLMHKREILRLMGKVGQEGVTLVPLSLYFSGSRVKMELGICRGKKLYDKREDLAKKQAARDVERYTKSRGRED
ncbi:MAG: SsrA-binding protein SmpB [Clostridia bacterium]|nr:SsrA-binding protein SmpB [Clostridia bacterium]